MTRISNASNKKRSPLSRVLIRKICLIDLLVYIFIKMSDIGRLITPFRFMFNEIRLGVFAPRFYRAA